MKLRTLVLMLTIAYSSTMLGSYKPQVEMTFRQKATDFFKPITAPVVKQWDAFKRTVGIKPEPKIEVTTKPGDAQALAKRISSIEQTTGAGSRIRPDTGYEPLPLKEFNDSINRYTELGGKKILSDSEKLELATLRVKLAGEAQQDPARVKAALDEIEAKQKSTPENEQKASAAARTIGEQLKDSLTAKSPVSTFLRVIGDTANIFTNKDARREKVERAEADSKASNTLLKLLQSKIDSIKNKLTVEQKKVVDTILNKVNTIAKTKKVNAVLEHVKDSHGNTAAARLEISLIGTKRASTQAALEAAQKTYNTSKSPEALRTVEQLKGNLRILDSASQAARRKLVTELRSEAKTASDLEKAGKALGDSGNVIVQAARNLAQNINETVKQIIAKNADAVADVAIAGIDAGVNKGLQLIDQATEKAIAGINKGVTYVIDKDGNLALKDPGKKLGKKAGRAAGGAIPIVGGLTKKVGGALGEAAGGLAGRGLAAAIEGATGGRVVPVIVAGQEELKEAIREDVSNPATGVVLRAGARLTEQVEKARAAAKGLGATEQQKVEEFLANQGQANPLYQAPGNQKPVSQEEAAALGAPPAPPA